MSGCLSGLTCNCNIDWEGKRNAVASVASGTLFFAAWWMMIDTAAVYGKEDWTNVYIIITVASSISMFMVNAISNSQLRGESLQEGVLGTKGSRLWVLFAFSLAFACIIASIWVLFADYVLRTATPEGTHPMWPGVALFLHNLMIFAASIVYKCGRTEELWG